MCHDKGIVTAMATKFSENFAISILKKHGKICGRGLTQLDDTYTFIDCSETYVLPCM